MREREGHRRLRWELGRWKMEFPLTEMGWHWRSRLQCGEWQISLGRLGRVGIPLGIWAWALESSVPDIKMQKGLASGEV